MQKSGVVVIQLNNQANIHYLVGSPNFESKVWKPFDEILCDFLSELSSLIRKDERTRLYPDLATFCFWARKGNLKQIKEEHLDDKPRLGLGTSFHVTPGNVPTNFAFSFAFSFLAGNSNIVKVPSRDFAQVEIFTEYMSKLLKDKRYETLKNSNVFIKYEANNLITKDFIKIADMKILWGANETINSIQQLPAPPRSRTLAFANRSSISVIDSQSILGLDKKALTQLANDFYNDTYLMDQNACSSPSTIIWLGSDPEKAKAIFWQEVKSLIKEKYIIQTSSVVDKFTELCTDLVTKEVQEVSVDDKRLYRLNLKHLTHDCLETESSCGYFHEYSAKNLDQILPLLDVSCQTVTYYGDIKDDILNLVLNNKVKGVDRIVPIGKALEIGPNWDGIETLKLLSRTISSM